MPHPSFPPGFATRRRTLLQLGSLAALGMAPALSSLSGSANAGSTRPYKALVCVYLNGGNDGNNMVVPTDSATYAQYLAARGGVIGTADNAALALPNAGDPGGVLPLRGSRFGLHPAMPELRALYDSGNLALLFNVGNLVRPFASAADFRANTDSGQIPENLFSHLDQVHQTQITSLGMEATTGWAGRLADYIATPDNGMPAMVSAAGNALLLTGKTNLPLVVPQSGAMNFNFFSADAPSQARQSALQTLIGNPGDSALALALAANQGDAMRKAALLQTVLGGAQAAAMAAQFPNVTNSALSQQLAQVALLIRAATSGAIPAPDRQIFFVELGGFDTHDSQLGQHAALLAELSRTLASFHQVLVRMGQSDQVVTFTLSDFGRTMQPTSNGGSDHGWGSHHLILSGASAVKSGTYGEFPSLLLSGPSDVSDRGRWLPTTSIDQYGATLANWLDAPVDAVAQAFPNLRNFASAHLGFLT